MRSIKQFYCYNTFIRMLTNVLMSSVNKLEVALFETFPIGTSNINVTWKKNYRKGGPSTRFLLFVKFDAKCGTLTLSMLGRIAYFMSSAAFFWKLFVQKNIHRNTIRVTNSLDPDQAQHIVGPDLGPKFQTVCKGHQQTTQAGKERQVNTFRVLRQILITFLQRLVRLWKYFQFYPISYYLWYILLAAVLIFATRYYLMYHKTLKSFRLLKFFLVAFDCLFYILMFIFLLLFFSLTLKFSTHTSASYSSVSIHTSAPFSSVSTHTRLEVSIPLLNSTVSQMHCFLWIPVFIFFWISQILVLF